MRIVCALDVHRRQITNAIVEVGSGEMSRGRISPATRAVVREWLARFDGVDEVQFALEGTTGWRFVVEEIERAGHRAHLADPAETAAKRGRKRRAKTDRADCDLLLRLLAAGELPESWIPPAQILEVRTRVRLRKRLIDERTTWQQRLQAQLFHQGAPGGLRPRTRAGREALAKLELSPAGRELVTLALRMIETIDRELAPLDRALSLYARRQPGCRELIARLYGVGPVTATAIVAELGDARRFRCSDDAVRHCGLDVTVHQSDRKRAPGHSRTKGRSCCVGRCSRRRSRRVAPPHPTTTTTGRWRAGSTTTALAYQTRASSADAPSTSCASSVTRRSPQSRPHPRPRR
jgi:transposase